jgi:integration host factor subunit beta
MNETHPALLVFPVLILYVQRPRLRRGYRKSEVCMNKSELVEALAARNGLTYKKSEEIVNIIFDSMSDALTTGGRIEIRGFGSFVVKDYQAYMGRNPKTGEVIKVKPKKLPFFKVGKELREKVNS